MGAGLPGRGVGRGPVRGDRRPARRRGPCPQDAGARHARAPHQGGRRTRPRTRRHLHRTRPRDAGLGRGSGHRLGGEDLGGGHGLARGHHGPVHPSTSASPSSTLPSGRSRGCWWPTRPHCATSPVPNWPGTPPRHSIPSLRWRTCAEPVPGTRPWSRASPARRGRGAPPLGTLGPTPPTMEGKAMAPVVQFRAAVALAGRFPALAGVELCLEQGEVVVVVGANGAGKTSLLRACAGLLPVTSGEATVLGVDLTTDHTSVRRYVGLFGRCRPPLRRAECSGERPLRRPRPRPPRPGRRRRAGTVGPDGPAPHHPRRQAVGRPAPAGRPRRPRRPPPGAVAARRAPRRPRCPFARARAI